MTPAPPSPLRTPDPLLQQLNVVKISLCLPGISVAGQLGAATPNDKTRVLFEISIQGELVGRLEATADEMGLPLTLAQARESQGDERPFRLPGHILAALDSVVPRGRWPLWLSFPLYSGYLPVLPWEPLLKDRLKVPILRLSYTDVQPIRSRQSLDAVVCFSFPRAKEFLAAQESPNHQTPEQTIHYFFERIPPNLAPYTTFHAFADQSTHPVLTSLRDRHPEFRIVVYDPRDAARYGGFDADSELATASAEQLESPWLLWIRDAMGLTSVDLAHFICHGYLGKEEGLLAVSHSPVRDDDEEWSRFIGARQLCTFLDQVGAWSVAFSSPPANYSISGLRMLQDQIARIRPGPVLFHDMVRDPDRVGWDEAYQYAYAVEEAGAPKSAAVSLCCHPDWALPGTAPDSKTQRLLKDLSLAGRIPEVFEGSENTPSWLASGQRALERSVAQLFHTSPDDPDTVMSSGSADALRFAAKLLERHAAKFAADLKDK
jgi:hypothetical protein